MGLPTQPKTQGTKRNSSLHSTFFHVETEEKVSFHWSPDHGVTSAWNHQHVYTPPPPYTQHHSLWEEAAGLRKTSIGIWDHAVLARGTSPGSWLP